MAISIRTESEAVGQAPLSGRSATSAWSDQPIILRLVSVALFAGVWEIAGRIPVSFAFPTFSDTIVAFFGLIADGSLASAYLSTLQPLVLGVVLSAFLGVGLGTHLRLVAHRRMVSGTGVHRASGGACRCLHSDGHLCLWDRHDRQDARRDDSGAAGDRPQHLQGGSECQRIAAGHVPIVSGDALADDHQDHSSRRQPGHLRRIAPGRLGRLRRRCPRRIADHSDRNRRSHHIPPLSRGLCRDVCNHWLDHRSLDLDARRSCSGWRSAFSGPRRGEPDYARYRSAKWTVAGSGADGLDRRGEGSFQDLRKCRGAAWHRSRLSARQADQPSRAQRLRKDDAVEDHRGSDRG